MGQKTHNHMDLCIRLAKSGITVTLSVTHTWIMSVTYHVAYLVSFNSVGFLTKICEKHKSIT